MQREFGKTEKRLGSVFPASIARILFLLALLAGVVTMSGTLCAQVSTMEPGSVLIFPMILCENGADSFLSITNVNRDVAFDPRNLNLFGDVVLHYFYVAGDDCFVFNRREYLTPGDTLTVLSSYHNLDGGDGWLYVVCEDPATLMPCDFDIPQRAFKDSPKKRSGILGDCFVFDGIRNTLVNYPAIAIKCLRDMPPPAVPIGAPAITFGGAGSGTYEQLPTSLYLSSFFEGGGAIDSELVLLPIITATRDLGDFRVDLDFLFYNNMEVEFSQEFSFRCWLRSPLKDIFNGADNLEGDPDEFFYQKGWAKVEVERVIDMEGDSGIIQGPLPILGLIYAYSSLSPYMSYAQLLHHSTETLPLFSVDGTPSPSLEGAVVIP